MRQKEDYTFSLSKKRKFVGNCTSRKEKSKYTIPSCDKRINVHLSCKFLRSEKYTAILILTKSPGVTKHSAELICLSRYIATPITRPSYDDYPRVVTTILQAANSKINRITACKEHWLNSNLPNKLRKMFGFSVTKWIKK